MNTHTATTKSIILAGFLFSVVPMTWAEDSDRNALNPNSSSEARSSVKSLTREDIQEISARIDALVLDQLRERQQTLNEPANDEIFLRRIYLDAVGRIPTLEETTEFLESTDPLKRAELIDNLLDSYGYVSRQFNFFADLLRVKSRDKNVIGQPYIDFIKDSLTDNKPYDEFVRELLTAEGPMMRKGNGQVGYYLRDVAMPEDNMSNTVRIFLGTRLECAQCHDHPFDKWTQRQYFEMVAFTGGMSYRPRRPDSVYSRELMALRGKRNQIEPELFPILRNIIQPMTYGIQGSGTGLARLPEGFMGDDGEEFEIIQGKTMFGDEPLVNARIPELRRPDRVGRNPQIIPGAQEIDSRARFAEWLTDSQNPRFAQVIANRMWKQAMGLGLIEPVDVIEDSTVASNPALMDYLARTMIDLDFDLKQFMRAIYNTSTYQRTATGTDVIDVNKYDFSGPIVRRMTAEQIWDSLLTMTVENIDERQSGSQSRVRYLLGDTDIYESYERLRQMKPEELLELAKSIKSGNRAARTSMMMDAEREKYQAEMAALRKQLAAETRKAKRTGNQRRLRELQVKRSEMVAQIRRKQMSNNLKRASEIESPARPGHFLREFGQSDREAIDNSNSDPAITQVLSLMNGVIEKQIANNPNTVLMRNVMKSEPDQIIATVYLTMLNRNPTDAETSGWIEEYETSEQKSEVIPDLIWVLANSNEFIFVK